MVVEAKWLEARKFGGTPTLVEEDLAWWWRDARKVTPRQREGRLPEQRGRRRDETAAGGSRGFIAGSRGERRRRLRRQGARVVFSPEFAEREGGDSDGRRWQWQRNAVAGICREKWRSSTREEERGFIFEP